MPNRIAFALAGLGGFNAHGAGFLTAARELGVKPDLVTASSGQIIVLAEWLRGNPHLEKLLVDTQRLPSQWGTFMVALRGMPGVFEPALKNYWARWLVPPLSLKDLSERLLPAQQYVPLRKPGDFQEVADVLNDPDHLGGDGEPLGVVFNAYNLVTGEGALFGNDAARDRLEDETRDEDERILPITAEAVESALWLSFYGFEKLRDGLMDGAYHRPCMIADLHDFDRIYAVRPLAKGWVGEVPKSWFDVQDWNTEMWFSVGYKAEVAELKRINQLYDEGHLQDTKYRKVELVEIAAKHPAGYFHFFTERKTVFHNAHKEARQAFLANEFSTGPREEASGHLTSRAAAAPQA